MPFRFLNLSAELRNHIYAFAAADLDLTNRHFFALTQVCTQIRAECRPLYLTSFPTLPLTQLLPFLNAFLPTTNAALMSEFTATLTVDASRDSIHWSADILSTLRLLVSAPTVKIKLAYPHWPASTGLLEKLGTTMDAWCTILASNVISRVEILSAEHNDDTYFSVYMSKEPFGDRVLSMLRGRSLVTKVSGVDMWIRKIRIREGDGEEKAFWKEYLQEKKGSGDEWCRAWERVVEVFEVEANGYKLGRISFPHRLVNY